MSKFAKSATPARLSPMSAGDASLVTHEGGDGFYRDHRAALFMLAASNMSGEDTFYEGKGERDARYRALIASVVAADPGWIARFVPYLRTTMLMRSASVVMAAEYARAKGPRSRAVVASACARPDEPGEMLGYWIARYGKRIPKPVKRGIADAAVRLFTEAAALKFDSARNAIRMGDVLDLCHAKPKAPWQSALFRHLLDRRRNHETPGEVLDVLPKIRAAAALEAMPVDARRAALPEAATVFTWERLSGWLPGGMDREAWEAIIPSMGVMALLRNLRNFDEAKVSDEVADLVAAKLSDPEAVKAARVFPLRFFSAFKALASLRWGRALERGIQATLANVPVLPGRTLIMVDNSASMRDRISARSAVRRCEVAGLFSAALALRCEHGVAVSYDYNPLRAFSPKGGEAVLLAAAELGQTRGGTNTWACTAHAVSQFGPFDRVVILTDEQAHDGAAALPGAFPVYTFNLAGYAPSHAPGDGRFVSFGGGLTDSCFTLLAEMDRARSGRWPF